MQDMDELTSKGLCKFSPEVSGLPVSGFSVYGTLVALDVLV